MNTFLLVTPIFQAFPRIISKYTVKICNAVTPRYNA
uniref:Uncharacterized protein n=1 Tax=Myoviridae sp. ctOpw2 TaxID=2825093 RepID=A0A8S5UDD1_9CAUD|nr:MAG TPA: hypothetical protein [Myoviridae sp. ctOpw2]DAJ05081.1 MAG TPA: hypothetical protein [Caudoviricetes sp.]DAL73918.1 MAG TPA: hypothetical protein [Caudoviricetes sp.]